MRLLTRFYGTYKIYTKNLFLVPADKASNNVLVVCKKYYLDVVIKELSSKDSKWSKKHMKNVVIM